MDLERQIGNILTPLHTTFSQQIGLSSKTYLDGHMGKDNWDKAQIVGTFLITLAIAVSGFLINNTLKDKEIKLQYIEMAIDILKEKPNENTKELRLWAIDIVQDYSIKRFSEKALAELKNSALPSGYVWLDGKVWKDEDIWREEGGKPVRQESGELATKEGAKPGMQKQMRIKTVA